MIKILLFLLLLVPNVYAQEEVKTIQITDDGGLGFLDESGHKVVSEYVEQCHDEKGRFSKCPKDGENGGFITKKIVRQCHDETGKFIKCPKKDK